MKNSVSQYEVFCPACNVTYPVGQSRCIHCGGRIVSNAKPEAGRRFSGSSGLNFDGAGETLPLEADVDGRVPDLVKDSIEPEKEEKGGRFGFLRSGMTVIWILLAVIFSIMRACGEGSN